VTYGIRYVFIRYIYISIRDTSIRYTPIRYTPIRYMSIRYISMRCMLIRYLFIRYIFIRNTPIPCVTEHPGFADFLFGTFAKQFYISARIQTNLRDNFTNLSAL
jgi:hypothetical protein